MGCAVPLTGEERRGRELCEEGGGKVAGLGTEGNVTLSRRTCRARSECCNSKLYEVTAE